MNYSCQWLCSAVAISLTILNPSQRMHIILLCTLLLVYAPSSGLLLQDMVATFIGLSSQKAARESSLCTHQSSLLWISSPACQEYQRNWICRNLNSLPPAQGSFIQTIHFFQPPWSGWLIAASHSLPFCALSLLITSYIGSHHCPKLSRVGITLSPVQPPSPCCHSF